MGRAECQRERLDFTHREPIGALSDRIAVSGEIRPGVVTAPLGLDGFGPVAHDDRMAALDEDRLTGQMVDQLLVITDHAPDYRSGGGQSRSAPGMTRPILQGAHAR